MTRFAASPHTSARALDAPGRSRGWSAPRARLRGSFAPGAALAAVIAGSGCGAVAPQAAGDAAVDTSVGMRQPLLKLAGCPIVPGERPGSSSSLDAPQLSRLMLGAGTPGQPLPGTLQIQDVQSDETTLIVQVNGAADYLACAISPAELSASQIDLRRITVTGDSTAGNFIVYFGIVDMKGNVSGYAVGTVALGAPGPIPVCGLGAPFQVLGRAPSVMTATYASANGTTADYLYGATTPAPLTIERRTQLFLDIGSCSHLLVAGSKDATKAAGWDNFLLVEYRSAPQGTIAGSWYYGTGDVVAAHASQGLVHAAPPTVAGTALDPPVPSSGAFGYQPLALDVMADVTANVPAARRSFELTLYVLDGGGVGSTTDLWMFLQ